MSVSLEIRSLTKRYGEQTALDSVSLALEGGAVTTLLGPNGSGKTTLIKSILGLLRPDGGELLCGGEPCRIPYPSRLRRRFLYIPDDPIVSEYLTGRENLEYLAALYGAEASPARLEEILAKYGLAEASGKLAKDYSRGMRQRLCLSSMELYAPEVLILDEPTNGLDVLAIRQLALLLRELAEAGKLVLVATHDMTFAKFVSHRVAVIRRGEVIEQGEIALFTARYGSVENAVFTLLQEGAA